MIRRLIPRLVTLEGEDYDADEVAELLGIDQEDTFVLVRGEFLTPDEEAYLDAKYPELMGIWPIIAKIGAAVVKGGVKVGKKIASAVKGKKAKRAAGTAKMQEFMTSQIQKYAALKKQKIETEKEEKKKKLLQIAIPAAALLAIMLIMKR